MLLALSDHESNTPGMLSFHRGDLISLHSSAVDGWCFGSIGDRLGRFPENLCKEVSESFTVMDEPIISTSSMNAEDAIESPYDKDLNSVDEEKNVDNDNNSNLPQKYYSGHNKSAYIQIKNRMVESNPLTRSSSNEKENVGSSSYSSVSSSSTTPLPSPFHSQSDLFSTAVPPFSSLPIGELGETTSLSIDTPEAEKVRQALAELQLYDTETNHGSSVAKSAGSNANGNVSDRNPLIVVPTVGIPVADDNLNVPPNEDIGKNNQFPQEKEEAEYFDWRLHRSQHQRSVILPAPMSVASNSIRPDEVEYLQKIKMLLEDTNDGED